MQISNKLYIPAVAFIMAIMAFALSPMSLAIAQESTDADSSEYSSEDNYEGKDGKSCDKNRTQSTKTHGNQAIHLA